jgi:pyruvate dehydrogenase complex dehydrogenase (E1) component
VESGAYIREHFFGRDERAAALVKDYSDDDIWNLKRGGHDYRKVYAAFKAATEHKGKPTVILAKTVKGYGLGPQFEGRNATHQMKKMTRARRTPHTASRSSRSTSSTRCSVSSARVTPSGPPATR